MVRYSITGGNASLFDLDPVTGVLKTAARFDHETSKLEQINITATDGGHPALSATVAVVIRIVNVDDHAPHFTLSTYQTRISENANVSDSVLQVSATDLDPGSTLTYSITGGNTQNAFTIDASTGLVSVARLLDRETIPFYSLSIQVLSQSSASQVAANSSTAVLNITISDENDHAPVFTQSDYVFRVLENEDVNSVIGAVTAMDSNDVGSNARIAGYSLVLSNGTGVFSFDTSTGTLRLARSLDRESVSLYRLEISAHDDGVPSLSATATVDVVVLDVNDNHPQFTQTGYNVTIREDVSPGHTVTTVSATDADVNGNAVVTYHLLTRSVPFTIGQTSGVITTNAILPPPRSFALSIEARDGGSPSLSFTVTVSVRVSPAPDSTPVFSDSIYFLNVSENAPVGQQLVSVQAQSGNPDFAGTITYALQNDSTVVGIDSENGSLRLISALNHEAQTSLDIAVTASLVDFRGRLLTAIATVSINVLDMNDNRPQFDMTSYTFGILETAPTGAVVGRVNATDPDSRSNGRVAYHILSSQPSSGVFSVNNTGYITLLQSIDREVIEQYTLNISATDGGVLPLASFVSVTINVLDVNDNSPIFTQQVYTAEVAERSSRGTPVITVTANDADFGRNGEITYTIESGNLNSTFALNSTSGALTVLGELDFETLTDYRLVVIAEDKGQPLRNSSAIILVNVTDVDDSPPVFPTLSYAISTAENTDVGTNLLQVQATDADGGLSPAITYAITSGDANDHFRLNAASGELFIASSLDRETLSRYDLVVVASNGGATGPSSTATIVVTVTDVNDNQPKFVKEPYSFNISEAVQVGFPLGTLQATDLDLGLAGRVAEYNLTDGNIDNVFNISNSGRLTVAQSLDFDTQPSSYLLVASATDGGNPSLTGTVNVLVFLSDFNDNAPMFDQPSYKIRLSEATSAGDEIANITATDRDSGINAVLSYSLQPAQTKFQIDSRTGSLKIAQSLDREVDSSYTFSVLAQDSGQPSLTSTVTVDVEVLDENDERPTFPVQVYNAQVRENTAVATTVTQIVAGDGDQGTNARLEYRLLTSGPFAINTSTGVVSVNGSLDREADSFYSLVAVVKDGGLPSLSSQVVINITILDKNDNSPQFADSQYNVSVAEDIALSTPLLGLSARDDDIGNNAIITYSIIGGDPLAKFSMNGSSLVTSGSLDRETTSSYHLTILAADGGSPRRSASATVQVKVTDVNDNTPMFTKQSYLFSVSEATLPNTVIGAVSATDADTGSNAQLVFSLHSDGDGRFAVNASTGQLSLLFPGVDFELKHSYDLVVEVRDRGMPSRNSTTTVRISVTDANDNAPVFTQQRYNVTVLENVTSGDLLTKVSATDADSGTNAQLTYSISRHSHFSLNVLTGDLEVVGSLDRETTRFYQLVVMSLDGGTPQMTGTATVDVTVGDVNDNAPQVSPTTSQAVFTERGPAVRVAEEMNVSDADTFPMYNMTLTLTLSNGSAAPKTDMLSADGSPPSLRWSTSSDNHTLTLNGAGSTQEFTRLLQTVKFSSTNPEPDATPRQIDIQVSDGLFVSTVSKVTIAIQLVNDNPPFLSLLPDDNYTTTFVENGAAVPVVPSNISITDADSGQNSLEYINITLLQHLDGQSERLQGSSLSSSIAVQTVSSGFLQLVGQAPLSDYEQVLQAVTYINQATEPSSPDTRTVQFVAFDGVFSSNTAITMVNINRVNDPPSLVFPTAVVGYNETQSSVVLVQPGFQLTDVDNTSLSFLQISIVQYHSASDFLNAVTTGTRITATFSQGHLILLGPDTLANFRRVLATVTFSYRLQAGETFEQLQQSGTIRTATFVANDGLSNSSVATSFVSFSAVNNAPLIDANGPAVAGSYFATEFTENGAGSLLVSNDLIIQDPDSATLVSATATLNPLTDGPGESLSVNVSSTAVMASYNSVSGHLSVNGTAPLSVYQLVLGTLTYRNQGDNITGGQRRVQLQVSDGQRSSTPVLLVVTVHAVNDPPTLELDTDHPGVTYQTNFTEGSARAFIARPNHAELIDPDNTVLDKLLVVLTNPLDGSSNEGMTCCFGISLSGLIIKTSRFRGSSRTEFSFAQKSFGTVAAFRSVLTSLTYSNSAPEPTATLPRQIQVITFDSVTSQSRTATASISIQLINDNSPVFTPSSIQETVSENTGIGQSIAQLTANDLDVDSVIQYSLHRSFGVFSINASTGVIDVAGRLDADAPPTSYSLNITAFDGLFYASGQVFITLSDYNDNPPIFPSSIVNISVKESAPINSNLTQLVAFDADSGVNALVHYTIIPGAGDHTFSVNRLTGLLQLASSLDYETTTSYQIRVQAHDEGLPTLSSTVLVFVSVIDVNDNSPVFAPASNKVTVAENVPVGSIVYTATATDADSGSNAELTYSINSTDFTINSSSGEIITAVSLDHETLDSYTLAVTTQDGGLPSRSARFILTVMVSDANDHSPVFENSSIATSVPEDASIGHTITTVTATDLDSGTNGQVHYSIVSGNTNDRFDIDRTMGVITVSAGLDRETTALYSLVVMASDLALIPRQTTANISITVTDVNDNSPVFNPTAYSMDLLENTTVLSFVLRVTATDADIGTNGAINYTIRSGNLGQAFEIDATTGALTLVNSLDRETRASYSMVVDAVDEGNPQKQSSSGASVIINVLDINDNRPEFPSVHSSAQLEENKPIGTLVADLQASDRDISSNGLIHYSLVPTSQSVLFTINTTTGRVSSNVSFDFETGPHQVNLTVVAQDEGVPSLSSTASLTVNIVDLNDNSPTFDSSSYSVAFPENSTGFLVNLTASDPDSGTNAKLSFSLISGSTSLFSLDPMTGEISVASSLDRETAAQYILDVRVTDQGQPPSIPDITRVNVTVLDINDNAPVFSLSAYSANVPDNSSVETSIVHVSATDADEGTNGEIFFSIVSGNGDAVFAMNSSTGVVSLAHPISDNVDTYQLTIRATDGGSPSLSTDVTLTLTVSQRAYFDFSVTGVGYPLTTTTTRSSLSFAFFVGSSFNQSGTVTASLGNLQSRETFAVSPRSPVSVELILIDSNLYSDSRQLRVLVQVSMINLSTWGLTY